MFRVFCTRFRFEFVSNLELSGRPQDPAVLKIRRSKFTMPGKFTIAQGFAMATPARADTIFLGLQAFFPPKRGSQCSKHGGRVKTLRRSISLPRSVFSTPGSFDINPFLWKSGQSQFWECLYDKAETNEEKRFSLKEGEAFIGGGQTCNN